VRLWSRRHAHNQAGPFENRARTVTRISLLKNKKDYESDLMMLPKQSCSGANTDEDNVITVSLLWENHVPTGLSIFAGYSRSISLHYHWNCSLQSKNVPAIFIIKKEKKECLPLCFPFSRPRAATPPTWWPVRPVLQWDISEWLSLSIPRHHQDWAFCA
jgi:hypothetical protein